MSDPQPTPTVNDEEPPTGPSGARAILLAFVDRGAEFHPHFPDFPPSPPPPFVVKATRGLCPQTCVYSKCAE